MTFCKNEYNIKNEASSVSYERVDIMKIMLPKHYFYSSNGGKAYVSKEKLYIEGNVNYERLIYDIVYSLKGKTRCYYCGKKLSAKNRTLDHKYPRYFGGISIPENLEPCCKECNLNKLCMTEKQFLIWNEIESIKEQDLFFQSSVKKNTEVLKKKKFLIPNRWVEMYDVAKYFLDAPFKRINKKKFKKLENYYKKWHQYPKPIIVSANGWVFEGNHIITHAKKINKHKVCAVVLENVIVKRNSR